MTESVSNDNTTNQLSVKEVKGPNLVERAKDEFEAILHTHNNSSSHNHHKINSDINENTSVNDVKAPNVFERAKEEFQAIAQVLHHKKETSTHHRSDGSQMEKSKHHQEISSSLSEKKSKEGNVFVRSKEEIKGIIHHDKSHHHHHHHKETHGRSDDIDENTPIDEVKGPNVFERVKEEFEAVFQAMHPKKEKKEG